MDELFTLLESTARLVVGMVERCTSADLRRRAILACQSLLDRVTVAQAKLIATATEHEDWRGTGARNMSDWLAGTTRSSYSAAKRKQSLGSALGKSRDLDDAVASGSVSPDAAEALADAVNNPPDSATEQDVADLVQAAAGATPGEARDAANRWKQILSEETDEQATARRFAARNVTSTVPIDGLGTTSITLPTLAFREFLTAIAHAAGERPEGDPRTTGQRLADGVINLTQWYAAAHPTSGGRSNPNLVIVFSAEAYAGLTDDPGFTAWGDRIPAHVVRELAKHATLQRVVMAGNAVLNMGRKVRYATEDQYLAMIARDGHCRWGQCSMPGTWCEADHIVEWEHQGLTDIDNLWLLCEHHHHERHRLQATLHGRGDRMWIELPDGTRIDCPPHGHGNRPPDLATTRERHRPPGGPPERPPGRCDSGVGGSRPGSQPSSPPGQLHLDVA